MSNLFWKVQVTRRYAKIGIAVNSLASLHLASMTQETLQDLFSSKEQ